MFANWSHAQESECQRCSIGMQWLTQLVAQEGKIPVETDFMLAKIFPDWLQQSEETEGTRAHLIRNISVLRLFHRFFHVNYGEGFVRGQFPVTAGLFQPRNWHFVESYGPNKLWDRGFPRKLWRLRFTTFSWNLIGLAEINRPLHYRLNFFTSNLIEIPSQIMDTNKYD